MTGQWKLVPVEADDGMTDAYLRTSGAPCEYEFMVQAAPSPPDDVLERMALVHQRTRASLAAQHWNDENWPSTKIEKEAMRAALSAAEEHSTQGEGEGS